MLLIENNETKRIERHENGRARPHHQQRLFRMKTALPHPESLAIAAAAVEFEDPCPKAAPTTINKLGYETDFRRQDQHMATSRQLLGCQLEVDLRLPGTRDSPKQQPCSSRQGVVAADHLPLLIGEGLGGLQVSRFNRVRVGRIRRLPATFSMKPSLLFEGLDECCAEALPFQRSLPSRTILRLETVKKLLLANGWLSRASVWGAHRDPPHLTTAADKLLASLTKPTRRQGRLEHAKGAEMAALRHRRQPCLISRRHSVALQQSLDGLELLIEIGLRFAA